MTQNIYRSTKELKKFTMWQIVQKMGGRPWSTTHYHYHACVGVKDRCVILVHMKQDPYGSRVVTDLLDHSSVSFAARLNCSI